MPISTEELTVGQKAYQRIKTYEMNLPFVKWCFIAPTIIFGENIFSAYKPGHAQTALYWLLLYVLVIITGIYLQQARKKHYLKDLVLLEQLRVKYGSQISADISKEPCSLYFFFFQKRFPEFASDKSRFRDPFSN